MKCWKICDYVGVKWKFMYLGAFSMFDMSETYCRVEELHALIMKGYMNDLD